MRSIDKLLNLLRRVDGKAAELAAVNGRSDPQCATGVGRRCNTQALHEGREKCVDCGHGVTH